MSKTSMEQGLHISLSEALGINLSLRWVSKWKRERLYAHQQHEPEPISSTPPTSQPLAATGADRQEPLPPPRPPQRPKRGKGLLITLTVLLLLVVLSGAGLLFLPRLLATNPATKPISSQPPVPADSAGIPSGGSMQSNFEKGVIYPRWNQQSYGSSDTTWQGSLDSIKSQTGAQWLEVPILFSQPTSGSVQILPDGGTPSVDSFVSGIKKAHDLGYKVFFVPLLTVRQPGGWSGLITPAASEQSAWFANYWTTLRPYAQAAQDNNVDQMAIGTELDWLQANAPESFWTRLISSVRGIYQGTLTYDINWSTIGDKLPGWLTNPKLNFIGVSTYFPVVDQPISVDSKKMPALWHQRVQVQLDNFAKQLKKRILITEIGYRSTTDALYQPWQANSNAPSDPQQQAAAYNAVLTNVLTDSHIGGVFFWGWDGVGQLSIKGQPAVKVLQKWFGTPPS